MKWIAIVSMLIDHIGAILIENRMPLIGGVAVLDMALRLIGRLAFPIFAFLLVEGFVHTRDVRKYALRLGLFALLSEWPFDVAFFGGVHWELQNIFFTLLIGLLMLALVTRTEKKWVQFGAVLLAMTTAELLMTDYGMYGVAVILAFAAMRTNNWYTPVTAGLLLYQKTAPLALLPILAYDGTRGKQSKWLLYAFYPIHLLVLYGIASVLP